MISRIADATAIPRQMKFVSVIFLKTSPHVWNYLIAIENERFIIYIYLLWVIQYLRIPDLIFHWTVSVSNREPFWLVRWISLSLLQRCSHSWRCLKTSSWVCQPEPRLAAVAKWLQMKNTTESFCNWVLALCTLPCRIVPPRVLLGLVLALPP